MKNKKSNHIFLFIAISVLLLCLVYMYNNRTVEGMCVAGGNVNKCACPVGFTFSQNADGKNNIGCVKNGTSVNANGNRCPVKLKWDSNTNSCIPI